MASGSNTPVPMPTAWKATRTTRSGRCATGRRARQDPAAVPSDGRDRHPGGARTGSSAAAIVAGLIAANHMLELGLDDDQIFQAAARMEGHGDNVGAALHGGAILSVPALGRAVKLSDGADLDLTTVVYIPDEPAQPGWPGLSYRSVSRWRMRRSMSARRRDRGRIAYGRHRRDRGRDA